LARKVIRGVGQLGRTTEREIENEVNTMLQLAQSSHENIVEILGHGSLGQYTASYFIDMEYCDITLDDYIYGKETSVHLLRDYSKAVEDKTLSFYIFTIMQQIIRGLMFIHDHDKVHRDLKPKNSMPGVHATADIQSYFRH
jgi:serine/threonine protein kinase